MSYRPAGYEDEYDSSDSDDYFVGGNNSTKSQGNGTTGTNGNIGGFGMATPSKVQRDQQGSPIVLDDFKTAASRGKLEEVQEFIERGVEVDCMLKAGWTALMYAASCGQAEMVKYLLDQGANPDFHKASFMYSPLMAVCSSNLAEDSILECLTLLTDRGADVNTHEKSHMTPLMVASQHGHVKVVEKLLSCGAEVNNVDNRRWPALFYAAEGGHTRVVELLLANRADATKCSNDGTATDIAYSKDHIKLAEILEAAANPAKSKTANGTTSTLPPSSPTRVGGDIQLPTPVTPTPATSITTTTSIPPTTTNHQPPPPRPASTMSNHQSYHVLDDLELFLYGLKLGDLIPLFKDHEVTFPQLLQISEADLEKIGVSQVGHRKRIIDSIHAIHRKKWEPNSIRKPSLILSLPETHLILDNVNKHVAYIKSSIVHIRGNLDRHNSLTESCQEPGSRDLVSTVCSEMLDNTRLLHQELRSLKIQIIEACDTSPDVVPADLIEDPDKRGMSTLSKTLMALTALGVVVSVAWYSKPMWSSFVKPR